MRCKQGDIAIVVNGAAVGYIVTCVKRYDGPWFKSHDQPGWMVDKELPKRIGKPWPFIVDEYLLPIRPQPDDAVDQSFLRLPSPSREVA